MSDYNRGADDAYYGFGPVGDASAEYNAGRAAALQAIEMMRSSEEEQQPEQEAPDAR